MKDDFILENIFNTSFSKHALLSYIQTPFLTINQGSHTNYIEANAWAEILNELGYTVDIVQFDSPKIYSLEKYDLICGFGNVFENIQKSNSLKLIHYATGFNNIVSNTNSLNRLIDVYNKKGVILNSSSRYNPLAWRYQTLMTDAIISLGNTISSNTYRNNYRGRVFEINAPYYYINDAEIIYKDKEVNFLKRFLWFGSYGAVHKGLDLLLDFFHQNEQFELHICGLNPLEIDFKNLYRNELKSENIFDHGFLNLESNEFKKILKKCGFIIFPSCSEGGSPSLLNVVGNGGLYPIYSKETSIDFPKGIIINDFNDESIEKSILESQKISISDYLYYAKLNSKYVKINHSTMDYKKNLKSILEKILNDR